MIPTLFNDPVRQSQIDEIWENIDGRVANYRLDVQSEAISELANHGFRNTDRIIHLENRLIQQEEVINKLLCQQNALTNYIEQLHALASKHFTSDIEGLTNAFNKLKLN